MDNQHAGGNLMGANFGAQRGQEGGAGVGLGGQERGVEGWPRAEQGAGAEWNLEGREGAEKSSEGANQGRDWHHQGALGQVTLGMPAPGAMPPGAELGVIVPENDQERAELTGEKVVGTDRPKIQDREGLSPERMGEIQRLEHNPDLHARKKGATVEMERELKGRYGRIFGGED